MAIKAIGSIQGFGSNSSVTPAGTYSMTIQYAGLDPSNQVTGSIFVSNLTGDETKEQLRQIAETAIRADAISTYSYTFAAGDTVTVYGL
jgi:hypothetical protein